MITKKTETERKLLIVPFGHRYCSYLKNGCQLALELFNDAIQQIIFVILDTLSNASMWSKLLQKQKNELIQIKFTFSKIYLSTFRGKTAAIMTKIRKNLTSK